MNRPVTACCRSHGCSSSTSTVRERRAASSDHQQSSTTGARQFLLITLSLPSSNKYVGPPYRRIKMYAARWSRGNSSCRSISAGCPRLTSAANPPAAAAAVDRRKRQKDGRTDILPFYDALRILCEPRHNVNTTTAVTNMPFLQPQHVGKIRQYDLKDACESGLTQKRTDNVTVRCFHCGYTRASKLTRSQPPWLKRTLANLLSPTPTSHLREVSLSLALHESRLPCDTN